MNMQGLDTSSVITNVAANYRACHDTVIHEYSLLTDIDSRSMQRPLFSFYCLIVNGEQVPPSCQGGTFQLQDRLFHKALLVTTRILQCALGRVNLKNFRPEFQG